jgi:hypothetical protein
MYSLVYMNGTLDWTITHGDRYGQPTWVEAMRTDGAYIIVDTDDGAIVENGLVSEYGATIKLPSDVADQITAMIDG